MQKNRQGSAIARPSENFKASTFFPCHNEKHFDVMYTCYFCIFPQFTLLLNDLTAFYFLPFLSLCFYQYIFVIYIDHMNHKKFVPFHSISFGIIVVLRGFFFFFFFQDGLTVQFRLEFNSLCSSSWSQICSNPPASANHVPGLQLCAATPGHIYNVS